MRLDFYKAVLFICCLALPGAALSSKDKNVVPNGVAGKQVIWFDHPNPSVCTPVWGDGEVSPSEGNSARNKDYEWEHFSLPVGNGSIGANVFGSVATERLTFNEKTLWRGGPNTEKGADYYWNVNKNSAPLLQEIRQAFLDNDLEKASRLTIDNFNSTVSYEASDENPYRFGSFTTGGEFRIETGLDESDVEDYRRSLSLDSALVSVSFSQRGTDYRRECFVSYPDNVMVIRFTANRKGMQNLVFSYTPNPLASGRVKAGNQATFCYDGRLDNNGMRYVVRAKALHDGGKAWTDKEGRIHVEGADDVTFIVTADTDYRVNFDPDFSDPKTYVGEKPQVTTLQWLDAAAVRTYGELLDRHYADYSALFGRTHFVLNPKGKNPADALPMPKRMERYRTGAPDYGLETLYYQFGRYLLIASSRPGTMPANLQGMWQNNVDAPWHADYHNNINLQMNYWPACPTNLAECSLPLLDYIRTLQKPGERTAQAYFGARGWTASISGNIFGFTSPLRDKDMSWNFIPVAGPWLATHLWDYYDYTRDEEFLRSVGYDLIKSSAQFAVDYLWQKPDGTYTAAPSTSPEHGPVDEGTTFAHAVIREILLDAIAASEVLGTDSLERKQWEDVLQKITPYRVGSYGQLMEWSRDIDNPQDEHRHINHLFALHPGRTISPIATPALAKASRVVLEHRGDGATGWSMGWKLNQWARLHDGDRSYKLYGNLLKNGTNENLWDSHPPFQIDGNFGGTAGVTEMLLQSHAGFIHLLPALPGVWHDGELTGVCARGNFVLDLYWEDNNLKRAVVHSGSGVPCRLFYRGQELTFDTEKGKNYVVDVKDGMLKLNANNQFYVSLTGDDRQCGSLEKPFGTIERALAEARKCYGETTVYLREGTYRLTSPIVFTHLDGGEDKPLTLSAFPGEKVVVTSGQVLDTDWQVYENQILKTKIDASVPRMDMLFKNGEICHMARYPNYDSTAVRFNGTSADATSPRRVKSWKNPEGGYLHAMHVSDWGDFHYRILGKEADGSLILEGGWQNNRQSGLHPQNRMVENIFEELDAPNEWFYKKDESALYYFPAEGDKADECTFEVPVLKHLVEFKGTEDQPVTHITLKDITFTQTERTFMEDYEPLLRSDWTVYRGGAICFKGAEDCTLTRCSLHDLGGNAVFVSGYNRRITISSSHFTRVGASAICIVGEADAVRSPSFEYSKYVPASQLDRMPGPKSNNYPADCIVTDNLIHSIGLFEKQVTGVELSMCSHVIVSHNSIYDTPRAGINVSEGTWGGHIIEYNDVFDTVRETGDHGSFNSWGRDRFWHPRRSVMDSLVAAEPSLIQLDAVSTVVLRNNRFRCDRGWDIDLDDGSGNYHIYNNLCLNGGIKLREGFHRVVENNIMVNNTFHPHVWFKNSGDVFVRNVVMSPYQPIQVNDWGKEVDYNIFVDSLSYRKARDLGVDKHSVVHAPVFRNPSKGDYWIVNVPSRDSLSGFQNFDMDSFGVVSQHLKAIARTPRFPEPIVPEAEQQGTIFSWKGLRLKNLETLGERSATGMDSERGVYVVSVDALSCSLRDIVRPNDVILGLAGQSVGNLDDFKRILKEADWNQPQSIVIFRNQKEIPIVLPEDLAKDLIPDLALDPAKSTWFREAKFGMFIHWGLYSLLEGSYGDRRLPDKSLPNGNSWYAEWIQTRLEIPAEEYRAMKDIFNPVNYDPEAWVLEAKNAGMRYIVITSKHHDGFALWDSDVSDFDIASTPYKKDLIGPLVKACKKHGMKYGFYYSHWQDWEHPCGALPNWMYVRPDEEFEIYWQSKALPQVKELIVKYDPDLLWFDTWGEDCHITPERRDELIALVRKYSDKCLINGRICYSDPGENVDFLEMGDNYYPSSILDRPWQSPATMQESWGYHAKDFHWKSADTMVGNLIYSTSRGGNYLLNIGPKGDGSLPVPSVSRLREIGAWMYSNNEAIYGTTPVHIDTNDGIYLSQKEFDGKQWLYIALTAHYPQIVLPIHGVGKCEVLETGRPINYVNDGESLCITIPEDLFSSASIPVLKIEIDGRDAIQPATR